MLCNFSCTLSVNLIFVIDYHALKMPFNQLNAACTHVWA